MTRPPLEVADIVCAQGNQVTVRSDPEWRNKFFHLAMRRGRKIAKVAMARRLAVHLYWMWRKQWLWVRRPRQKLGARLKAASR